jgi:hypothetical protein
VVVTGLTGVNPVRALRWVTRHLWPGDPVRLCMLQGEPTPMAGWPRVDPTLVEMVIWRQRLWETQHISINKSFMCCDQVWNEPHQVLNWTKCFVEENSKSLALLKGGAHYNTWVTCGTNNFF